MVLLPSQTKGRLTFAEIMLPDNDQMEKRSKDVRAPAATITLGQMTININNEAEPDVIASVIKAASEIIDGRVFL
jgi:hypothetical protein